MILQDDEGNALVIDELKAQLSKTHVWCLDLKAMDYTLQHIKILEENTCNSVVLKVNDRIVIVPAYWYVLVCDPETTQIDAVQVSMLANNVFYALVYGSTLRAPEFMQIHVLDWLPLEVNVYPSITRNLMLCHDIGDSKWISLSFADTYNRFLKNKTTTDLINY